MKTYSFHRLAAYLVLLCCFSCMKKPLKDYDLQTEAQGLIKNIPENTDAKAFIPVSGYDVYVLGESRDSRGISVGYWKNGQWSNISAELKSPKDLFVSNDGHIYIAGSKQTTINNYDGDKAFYWQDNIPAELETEPDKFSIAYSIFVVNGDVYTCGVQYVRKENPNAPGSYYFTDALGIVWKGKSILYKFPNISLQKIKVTNGTVYTAGYQWTKEAYSVIYKNDSKWIEDASYADSDTKFDLNENSFLVSRTIAHNYRHNEAEIHLLPASPGNNPYINAVCLTQDQKVLLAGYVNLGKFKSLGHSINYAGLWRDGYFDRIETRFESILTDVKVIADQEFVIGNVYADNISEWPIWKGQAIIWVNGERFKLSGPYDYSDAQKLFIVKQ